VAIARASAARRGLSCSTSRFSRLDPAPTHLDEIRDPFCNWLCAEKRAYNMILVGRISLIAARSAVFSFLYSIQKRQPTHRVFVASPAFYSSCDSRSRPFLSVFSEFIFLGFPPHKHLKPDPAGRLLHQGGGTRFLWHHRQTHFSIIIFFCVFIFLLSGVPRSS